MAESCEQKSLDVALPQRRTQLARTGLFTHRGRSLCSLARRKIHDLIRPNTHLIWCEIPGSITMEVQDVPAIVSAAKLAGVPVALVIRILPASSLTPSATASM